MSDAEHEIISRLLRELSSEIDLHYEDDGLPTIADTFAAMRDAAEHLQKAGQPLPEVYTHILNRYLRGRN